MGRILVGATSWTERTLLESGWYPKGARSAAARLAWYASRFPITEVDSSYYALPSERNSHLWVERTPEGFVFDVKAYALLTHHPTLVESLPKPFQSAAGAKTRVYQRDLPAAVVAEVFEMFRSALAPLHAAGKLGCVLLQFPEWFLPSPANKEYLLEAVRRLAPYRCAVELRQRAWMAPERNAERTLAFLAAHALPYVCVDMPQGFPSSIPPRAASTSPAVAVVRFHGRDPKAWALKGAPTSERFRYRYDEGELREWMPRLRALASQSAFVHALFNNCHGDSAVRNAKELSDLLAGVSAGSAEAP